jgi:hypothetical protein
MYKVILKKYFFSSKHIFIIYLIITLKKKIKEWYDSEFDYIKEV